VRPASRPVVAGLYYDAPSGWKPGFQKSTSFDQIDQSKFVVR
jgi:hypothetical protein